MSPNTSPLDSARWNRALNIALGIALAFCLFNLATSLRTRHTTSLVNISTFSPQSAISVGQANKTAQIIGTGSTKVRLAPGDYQLQASADGINATKLIHVVLGHNFAANIPKPTAPALPSAASIDFRGMDEIVARGITASQATALENLFFDYGQKAKKVTIDSDNIANGHRDPDSNTPFTLNFTGTIDDKAYRATITYVGLDDMRLTIFDPISGAQLFDKSS